MFLFIGVPPHLYAHGFSIYDQGGKAIGMGEAFVAQADDPSAIFYNPAGITQLSGTRVYSGASIYMPRASFRSSGNADMGTSAGEKTDNVHNTFVVPHMYITHTVNKRVSFGLGVFSPFGLGQEWPDGWEGRYTGASIKSTISAITVNPVVAVKLSDRISLGFGPLMQNLEARYMSAVLTGMPVAPLTPGSNPATNASVRLKGNSYGYGWNSGILLQITDALKFGASYISRVTHEITDGEQEVTLSDGTVIKQDARSSIVLPAIGKTGIALTVNPWVVELDAEWIEWSVYNRSRVSFTDGTSIDTPKNWHDAWTWHLGTQYTVNQYIDLRAGVAYGQTPVPRSTIDPLVVGGNRIAYFLGLGSHLGKVTIDLGYIYTKDTGRTWDNSTGNVNVGNTAITQVKGRFVDTYCHTVAVDFGYRF